MLFSIVWLTSSHCTESFIYRICLLPYSEFLRYTSCAFMCILLSLPPPHRVWPYEIWMLVCWMNECRNCHLTGKNTEPQEDLPEVTEVIREGTFAFWYPGKSWLSDVLYFSHAMLPCVFNIFKESNHEPLKFSNLNQEPIKLLFVLHISYPMWKCFFTFAALKQRAWLYKQQYRAVSGS